MKLLYYTRVPLDENIYAPKLADSVHFAFVEGGTCLPLLHNSGIVYAKAVPGKQGVLHPYSLRDPWMTRVDDLMDVGIDALNPLEVKAGMKPLELKQK